jgi:hypothetical protein
MARSHDTVEVLPSPRRLTEVLRDVGYDFVSAVADIVDNSIAATASRIDITVAWEGPDSWIRIADNGTGMDAATINEALRFGSERTYRTDDLGKFGLGLKTASLSQCRQIWIASRVSPRTNRVEARRFDLDRIIRDDKWDIEIISANARPTSLTEPLSGGPGTVVLWTQLDRLLGFRVPRGESAHNALLEMTERLEQHLAMVFHRFLEGDVPRRRKLVITINGNKVAPWNPFALDEDKTKHLVPREFDINANGAQGFVGFDPYVLPTKEQFSSESLFNRMSGPNRWNHQQGLYIYRANRMIQSGGWSRLRAADEHTKLARAALDFFPELDPAFGINIAKMRVQLPAVLRDRLKDPLKELISAADKAYRLKTGNSPGKSAPTGIAGGSGAPNPKAKPTPPPVGVMPASGSSQGTAGNGGGISWPPQPLAPKSTDLRSALESAAKDVGEKAALDRIVKQLKADAPGVARDLGW